MCLKIAVERNEDGNNTIVAFDDILQRLQDVQVIRSEAQGLAAKVVSIKIVFRGVTARMKTASNIHSAPAGTPQLHSHLDIV